MSSSLVSLLTLISPGMKMNFLKHLRDTRDKKGGNPFTQKLLKTRQRWRKNSHSNSVTQILYATLNITSSLFLKSLLGGRGKGSLCPLLTCSTTILHAKLEFAHLFFAFSTFSQILFKPYRFFYCKQHHICDSSKKTSTKQRLIWWWHFLFYNTSLVQEL